jgi:hypothetical protein
VVRNLREGVSVGGSLRGGCVCGWELEGRVCFLIVTLLIISMFHYKNTTCSSFLLIHYYTL